MCVCGKCLPFVSGISGCRTGSIALANALDIGLYTLAIYGRVHTERTIIVIRMERARTTCGATRGAIGFYAHRTLRSSLFSYYYYYYANTTSVWSGSGWFVCE